MLIDLLLSVTGIAESRYENLVGLDKLAHIYGRYNLLGIKYRIILSYCRYSSPPAKSRLLVIKWQEASSLLYTPFQNGVLNLKTFELEPYKPEFYFRWQLSYDYNLLAKCDIFEDWLLETMGGDKAEGVTSTLKPRLNIDYSV